MLERVVKMMDVKTLADIAGKSRTSVYNLIERKKIRTFKKNGKIYLDENAVNIILAYYNIKQQETSCDIISEQKSDTSYPEMDFQPEIQPDFQDEREVENADIIRFLRRELEKSHNIIQGLIQSNQTLAEALKTAEQRRGVKLLSDKQKKEKDRSIHSYVWQKGFFKRIFKKI